MQLIEELEAITDLAVNQKMSVLEVTEKVIDDIIPNSLSENTDTKDISKENGNSAIESTVLDVLKAKSNEIALTQGNAIALNVSNDDEENTKNKTVVELNGNAIASENSDTSKLHDYKQNSIAIEVCETKSSENNEVDNIQDTKNNVSMTNEIQDTLNSLSKEENTLDSSNTVDKEKITKDTSNEKVLEENIQNTSHEATHDIQHTSNDKVQDDVQDTANDVVEKDNMQDTSNDLALEDKIQDSSNEDKIQDTINDVSKEDNTKDESADVVKEDITQDTSNESIINNTQNTHNDKNSSNDLAKEANTQDIVNNIIDSKTEVDLACNTPNPSMNDITKEEAVNPVTNLTNEEEVTNIFSKESNTSEVIENDRTEILEVTDSPISCESNAPSRVDITEQVCEDVSNDLFKKGQVSKDILDSVTIDSKPNSPKSDKIEDKKQLIENVDVEPMDVDAIENVTIDENDDKKEDNEASVIKADNKNPPLSLSNTLDILSDDDEASQSENVTTDTNKQCIDLIDDDDIMLIDDDSSSKDSKDVSDKDVDSTPKIAEENKNIVENGKELKIETNKQIEVASEKTDNKIDDNKCENENKKEINTPEVLPDSDKEEVNKENVKTDENQIKINTAETPKPLIAAKLIKSFKNKISDMTRDDLEDFCLLKIVEGVVERSNLSEIKTNLKMMTQCVDEWKKKAMTLNKQVRDLQIVLKTVQEEQKKRPGESITPLRITRSVGVQVKTRDDSILEARPGRLRKSHQMPNNKASKAFSPVSVTASSPKVLSRTVTPQPPTPIPVPRLVPAQNTSTKALRMPTPQVKNSTASNIVGQMVNNIPNGIRNSPPVQTKRTYSNVQSVTVDLTDDEPPAKQAITNRNAPTQHVRLVSPQQLLQARAQITPQSFPNNNNNNPRKVYIPISGAQSQNIRPGQSIMFKSVNAPPSLRMRGPNPSTVRLQHNYSGIRARQALRHPAPLPEETKQHHAPNLKAIPPAPDLKISKVENGIVISWKIEGYLSECYEEIASYQLYAYQETNVAPCTSLWKKIGDVKALPLPMACTLTQFMAGFKYYFAVRAVDIKSRVGQFSPPGSIMLLNKD